MNKITLSELQALRDSTKTNGEYWLVSALICAVIHGDDDLTRQSLAYAADCLGTEKVGK